ncbi:N-acetylmuramoyl-L-alanine amidase [Immundisolibacter sp.]|uniref:N-acetylmuramoyl-L-alanine amidase n=1 Tax=Immundisolibacter sp. TaxID=1934948 RepID=UPI00262FF27A|nr:N-acetylmuramoyl-L-alanine amidase [Immundisolibacter sp.]MDD3651141.1 N-acetylmuramoyl-L-alanine amidase [Immundisolibacter sp.]
MKRFLCCLLALLPLATLAGELRGVRYAPIAGGTRVTLELSAPTAGKVFSLPAPDRLVIDLPTTTARGALAAPAGGVLRGVRSGPQAGGALRVVFDLAGPAKWRQTRLPAGGGQGPRLQIDVLGAAPAVASKAARPAPAPAARQPATVAKAAPISRPQAADNAPAPVLRTQSARAVTVVIDAGHGGHDVGAVGPGRLYEKTVTLALARELAAQINAQRGMRAVLTRADDRFLELRDRTAVAHRHKADLFVSIHADAVAGGGARGSSVYALSEHGASSEAARLLAARENAAGMPAGLAAAGQDRMLRSVLLDLSQNATIEGSLRLGERLLDRIADVNKLHRSDVQQAGFMVLKSPQVPSVLVETAFISDPAEARKLADAGFRRRFAAALVAGIRDYLQTEPRLRQALAEAQTGRTPALRAADDGG